MSEPQLPENAEAFLKYVAVLESIAVQRELEAKTREQEHKELREQHLELVEHVRGLTGACNAMAAMVSSLASQLVFAGLAAEPDLRDHRSLS